MTDNQLHLYDREQNSTPGKASSNESSNNDISDEKKKINPPNCKTVLLICFLLLLYVGVNFIAAFIFIAIEKRPEEGTRHWFNQVKEEFLANHSGCLDTDQLNNFLKQVELAIEDNAYPLPGNNTTHADIWTLNNAFTLSVTVASTIGYGILTPITPGGQLFCIFFALLSIPFTGLLAAKLGSVMAYLIKKATSKAFGHFIKVKILSIVVTFLLGLMIYFVIPVLLLLYVGNDENWTFVECLYCIFITLTTIGFGDYVPNPSSNVEGSGGIGVSIAVLIYVIAGLAWLATIINLIAVALKHKASQLKQKVVKNKKHLRNFSDALHHKLTRGSKLKKPIPAGGSDSTKSKGSPKGKSLKTISQGESEIDVERSPWRKTTPSKNAESNDMSMGHSGLISVVLANIDDYDENQQS